MIRILSVSAPLAAILVLVLSGCPSPFGYYSAGNVYVEKVQTPNASSFAPTATPTFRSTPSQGGAAVTVSGSPTENSDQSVEILSDTPNAHIYYTVDGSSPSPNTGTTRLYDPTHPISVTGNNTSITIKAVALKALMLPSAIASLTMSISYTTAAAPSFDHLTGTYSGPFTLTITESTPGSTVWYTTDGTDPVVGGGTSTYSGAAPITISVSQPTTVKAVATATGWTDSAITNATYSFVVGMPVLGGSFPYLTLSTPSSGATVWYTFDGSQPIPSVSSSTTSTLNFYVGSTETLRAIAVFPGWSTSSELNTSWSVPSGNLDFQTLSHTTLRAMVDNLATTTPIDNSDTSLIPVGQVIVYKTRLGDYGKLVVVNNNSDGNNGWDIHLITYDSSGNVIADASPQIRGTWLCDLEAGVETNVSASSDFQLQNQTSTVRYLAPINGATFLAAGVSTTF